MSATVETDVLIVGAGPTGLALACQLIRFGVNFLIIDAKEGTTPFSKAIGVQARTLEIYEQIDLAQKLVDAGHKALKARMFEGGEPKAVVELAKLGEGRSPYPYLLIVEQGIHEAILYEFIKEHDTDVVWQTSLDSFSQDEAGVTATVVNATREQKTLRARYLVGCDGAKSRVRHALGMTFEGSTLERMFYVADVEINWEFTHDMLTVCLGRDRTTAFFPMPGSHRYRIVGVFPENHEKDEGEILYDEIEAQILEDTQLELDIFNVNWFSTYKVHSRRVNEFSNGRCFLAGDSAHIHSPAGAQGMNTGIQDGYNLAWKLALVLRGDANAKILNTYNEERVEVAERLLETTDRMFDLLMNPAWLLSFVRTRIFPHVANFLVSLESVNQFIFPLISQTGISYRGHTLSMSADDGFEVKAGDRMPYFLINGVSVYDGLREPKFHLIRFTNGDDGFDAVHLTQFAKSLDHHVFPFDAVTAKFFGANRPFAVLLRPDNYIAFITAGDVTQKLTQYFEAVLGVPK